MAVFLQALRAIVEKGLISLSTEGSNHKADEDDGSESEEVYLEPVPTMAP